MGFIETMENIQFSKIVSFSGSIDDVCKQIIVDIQNDKSIHSLLTRKENYEEIYKHLESREVFFYNVGSNSKETMIECKLPNGEQVSSITMQGVFIGVPQEIQEQYLELLYNLYDKILQALNTHIEVVKTEIYKKDKILDVCFSIYIVIFIVILFICFLK